MREACSLVWSVLVLLFQSRASLGAEILILRHQLNIQRRHLPKRLTLWAMDRLIVLGLAIPNPLRTTDGCGRNTTADPRDEHCQSAVGTASDPWRVAQARHRDRPDQRRQIHGQAKTPAVPRVENLYPQSR